MKSNSKMLPLHPLFTFLPVFLLIFFSNQHCCYAAKCNVDDEAGLLSFKSAITQDSSGMLNSWKPGTDCCTWSGIRCLYDDHRVTSLTLVGQFQDNPKSFLSGTISPSLSKLTHLDGIYLQNLRNLTGTFPTFIFNLPNLKYVYIEGNKLSGPIPAELGNRLSQLNSLSLAGNQFTGSIPNSISLLTQLGQLKLDNNLLSGSIPDGIGRLKNLTYLDLAGNKLSGKIPDFFTSFSDLRVLQLSNNRFVGNIPPTISYLAPKLAYLELGHNFLTGSIPDFLGKFTQLDTLDLSSNKLTGVVPKTFNNLTKIFNLDLSRNNLVDPFPQMNVKGIESLDLSYNQFNLVQIPKWVSTSPIIYSLKLAKCGIKMKLEEFKPIQTYFYDFIDLSENQISGSPVRLLNQTELLVGFWISGNKVQFNMSDLKIPKSLKYLDLARNQVFGKVPGSISGLEKFNVSHNHLCGQLPVTKFPISTFQGNDCLCGSPLPPCKK